MSFQFQNIAKFHDALRDGKVTCVQVAEAYLQRIEESRSLNAYVHVFAEQALERASALDIMTASGNGLLPLHGVIIALKDVFSYQDHPVSAGSKMLSHYISLYNATAVQRLLDAGAIIIGMANCDEFAMGNSNESSFYGPVLNPHDHERVPGGSSGGSAAAVAAGLCMVSLGTDTGGSVRQPADFCGVFGLKPTYGRISRYGVIAYASSFDCVGILAQNLEDIGLVYNQIAGPDEYDSTVLNSLPGEWQPADPDRKYRIAWLKPAFEGNRSDPEIITSINATLAQLAALGHDVQPVEFNLLEYITPTYYVLTTAEASSNLSRYDGIRFGHREEVEAGDLTAFYSTNRTAGFGKEAKRRIMLGSFVLSAGYYDAYFTKAQKVRHRIKAETAAIFSDFDALIMPVSPTVAPRMHENSADPVTQYLGDIFTVFANLSGVPALAVPLYRHSSGMPFGLQILAGHENEITLQHIGSLLHSQCRQI